MKDYTLASVGTFISYRENALSAPVSPALISMYIHTCAGKAPNRAIERLSPHTRTLAPKESYPAILELFTSYPHSFPWANPQVIHKLSTPVDKLHPVTMPGFP